MPAMSSPSTPTTAPQDPVAGATDTAFEHAPSALLVLDAAGCALRTNRAARQLLGWSPQDPLEGRPLAVLMRLEGSSADALLSAHLASVRADATVPPLELRVRHPSGESHTLQLTLAAQADAAGQVVQLHAWLLDVGAHRGLEQRLRAQVDFLSTLTDRSPSRLTYFGSDLICRFANRAQAERHGRTPQQMVGMHLSELIPPASLPRVMARVTRALAGEAQTFEAEGTGPDGQPRVGMFTTTDLRDALLRPVPPARLAVREVARFDLIGVTPDTELFEALLIMIRHRVHRVLVRDGDTILGVLSQLDLMSFISNHSHLIALQVEQAGTVEELQTAAQQIDGLVRLLHQS